MFATAIRGGCAGISSARTGSAPGIPAKVKILATRAPREIKAGRWRARSESEESEVRERIQQSPALWRRDDPHHPKTEAVAPAARIVVAAGSRARVGLIVAPRAAAHHPANLRSVKVFSSVSCPIGIRLPVMVANPRAVRHFAQALLQRSKNDRLDALVLREFVPVD